MAKLSKPQARLHAEALALLEQDTLTDQEKEFVMINYHEAATNVNTSCGAFFTPLAMAFQFAFEAGESHAFNSTLIDLCAGIGALSYAMLKRYPDLKRIVCVEFNAEYAAIGRKLVPEAEWLCVDVMDKTAIEALGHFDIAISNPPFGAVKSFSQKPAYYYKGADAEFKVIDVAATLADWGAFILPQESAGFRYSGVQCYENRQSSKYSKFAESTGISLQPGMGSDTTAEGMYTWCYDSGEDVATQWKGVSPLVEFALAEFGSECYAVSSPEQIEIIPAATELGAEPAPSPPLADPEKEQRAEEIPSLGVTSQEKQLSLFAA